MNTKSLIKLAEQLAAYRGLKLSTISTYATGGGRFFSDLKNGAGCTLKTANTLLEWFSENWPEGHPWPSDIPRPSTTRGAA